MTVGVVVTDPLGREPQEPRLDAAESAVPSCGHYLCTAEAGGLGLREDFPSGPLSWFTGTGKGCRGEHGSPKAVPLPSEVAGELGWALPLCLHLLHSATFCL